MSPARTQASAWLFSARTDLSAFVLPAVLSLGAVFALPQLRTAGPSPMWLWVVGVLLVDVAHVWSTLFVTYFDPQHLRNHWRRYWLTPTLSWLGGIAVYAWGGAALFWTALAYLAVFHFVKQQVGWLALYRRRGQEGVAGKWVDTVTIYACTLYPLLWWHSHLPRRFDWFLSGDFIFGLPLWISDGAQVAYWLSLTAYSVQAFWQFRTGEPFAWGKHLLVLCTASTWYVGIIVTNSDTAFTLTNVFTHGVPYGVLVFKYARHTSRNASHGLATKLLSGHWSTAVIRFCLCLWALAYLEELTWDRQIWREHGPLFGAPSPDNQWGADSVLVPLLAVPQLTHYLLDGWFWKRRHNSALGTWMRSLSNP